MILIWLSYLLFWFDHFLGARAELLEKIVTILRETMTSNSFRLLLTKATEIRCKVNALTYFVFKGYSNPKIIFNLIVLTEKGKSVSCFAFRLQKYDGK